MIDPREPTAGDALASGRTVAARWLVALPAAAFVGVVVAALVLLVLVVALLNPGERVGPVQPTSPPVGEMTSG